MKNNTLLLLGGGFLLWYLSKNKLSFSSATPPPTPPPKETLQDVKASEILPVAEQNTLANVQAELQRKLTKVQSSNLSERFKAGQITQITRAMRKAGIDPRITTGKLDYRTALYTPSKQIQQMRANTTDPSKYPISARYG